MIKKLIKEYQQRQKNTLLSPLKNSNLQINGCLKNLIDSLENYQNEPIKISILGHFSSGKSTFINTLLNAEILPYGIVPVTAKIVQIKYAQTPFLRVLYSNGFEEIHTLDKISRFCDQREKIIDVDKIFIYYPSEILKDFTIIDTPGLNSKNLKDTKESLDIFDKTDIVFWLSFIESCGKNSEKNDLELIPEFAKKMGLFIATQKDKINNTDVLKTIEYVKNNFANSFYDVFAVSSKMYKNGDSASNFDKVYDFLNKIKLKKHTIFKLKIKYLCSILIRERELYISIYTNIYNIILLQNNKFNSFIDINLGKYEDELKQFYLDIKEIASNISKIFLQFLEQKNRAYFIEKRAIFSNKQRFIKIDYIAPYFDSDAFLSKTIYNDERFLTIFTKFKSKLRKFFLKIKFDLEDEFKNYINEILLFKSKYENYSHENKLYSTTQISQISNFAALAYQNFVKDCQDYISTTNINLNYFVEKVEIQIVNNYINSIIMSCDFIANKLQKSYQNYEQSNGKLPLFYPKFDDFNTRVLTNLKYYEFEDYFVGDKNVIKQQLGFLAIEIKKFMEKSIDNVKFYKDKQVNNLNNIKNFMDNL